MTREKKIDEALNLTAELLADKISNQIWGAIDTIDAQSMLLQYGIIVDDIGASKRMLWNRIIKNFEPADERENGSGCEL